MFDLVDLVYEEIVLGRLDGHRAVLVWFDGIKKTNLRPPRTHPFLDAAIYAIEQQKAFSITPFLLALVVVQGYMQFVAKYPFLLSIRTLNGAIPPELVFDGPPFSMTSGDVGMGEWHEAFGPLVHCLEHRLGDNHPLLDLIRHTPQRLRPSLMFAIADVKGAKYERSNRVLPVSEDANRLNAIHFGGSPREWDTLLRTVRALHTTCPGDVAQRWLGRVVFTVERIVAMAQTPRGSATNPGLAEFMRNFIWISPQSKICGHISTLFPFDAYGGYWEHHLIHRPLKHFPSNGMRGLCVDWTENEETNQCVLFSGLEGTYSHGNIVESNVGWSVCKV